MPLLWSEKTTGMLIKRKIVIRSAKRNMKLLESSRESDAIYISISLQNDAENEHSYPSALQPGALYFSKASYCYGVS